jgi:hypothetical protein
MRNIPPIYYKKQYIGEGVYLDIIINIGYLIEFQDPVIKTLLKRVLNSTYYN